MTDHADYHENLTDDDFVVLVYEHLDGSLDASGGVRIRNYLKNPDYVSQFVAICHQEQVLHELLSVGIGQQTELTDMSSVSDCELWRQMAAYERQAPTVYLEPAEPACEPLVKVHRKPLDRKINTRLLVTTLVSLAACVCMIIYVHLVPRYVEEPVASVTDSLGIEMAGQELEAGDRLTNRREPFWLQKGVLEIEFLYGTRVVIEGPAQFRLESAEKLRLDAGRAYAKVPGSARGFVIGTPNSTIIDLGTEFGVQVDIDGTSAVHMLKGQATLIPGVKGKTGESQLLTKGQARQVDSSGDVRDIPVRQDVFVRGFSSANKMIWRGEAVLSIVPLPARGTDAAAGIRPDKTYTHLLDFGGGTPAVINGVAFTQVDHPEIKQDVFEDADNRFRLQKNGGYALLQTYVENKPQAWVFSDDGIVDLLTDFTYHGSNENDDHYTLSLTGLQPGTQYSLRLYYCPHIKDRNSRDITLIFSGDGKQSQITVNENETGAHYVSYEYVAVGTEVSVRFEANGSKDWQLYGVTNEVIAHE